MEGTEHRSQTINPRRYEPGIDLFGGYAKNPSFSAVMKAIEAFTVNGAER
jgi:hypothetical protein